MKTQAADLCLAWIEESEAHVTTCMEALENDVEHRLDFDLLVVLEQTGSKP